MHRGTCNERFGEPVRSKVEYSVFVCHLVLVVWATETSGAMDTQPSGHRVSSVLSSYLQRSYNVCIYVRGWRVPPMASVTVDLLYV